MVPKKRIQDQAASAPPLSLQQHRAGDSWYEIRTEGQRTRDESQLVHTELIALLYQHTPAAILGTSMAVLMTWVVIWGMVPPRVLLMWTAVMADTRRLVFPSYSCSSLTGGETGYARTPRFFLALPAFTSSWSE